MAYSGTNKSISTTTGRVVGVDVEAGIVGRHLHLVIAHAPVEQRPHAADDLIDRERLALDLVQALGVDEEAVAEQHPELAQVHLGDQHVLELLYEAAEALR